VVNSTFSANQAGLNGAGIINVCFVADRIATLDVINSTFANNSAVDFGGGIETVTLGPGTTATTSIRNNLFANNVPESLSAGAATDGGPATIESHGFNLASDDMSAVFSHPTDINLANAGLAPLADNGGPVPTHALLMGSDALDGGSNSGSGVLSDQRGFGSRRTVDLAVANVVGGDGSDIGAYEAQTEPGPLGDSLFADGFED
jgi:predicted outer membrane repeat protein